MKNILTLLAKRVLVPIGLRAATSATDAPYQLIRSFIILQSFSSYLINTKLIFM